MRFPIIIIEAGNLSQDDAITVPPIERKTGKKRPLATWANLPP